MTIQIPTDEALEAAYTSKCLHIASLRAVATIAATEAVKDALHKFYGLLVMNEGLGVESFAVAREMLCHYFPSPLTPTPPKEQQPVTDTHACDCGKIEHGRHHHACPTQQQPVQTVDRQGSSFRDTMIDDERTVEILRSVTPVAKPSPDPATVRLELQRLRSGVAADFCLGLASRMDGFDECKRRVLAAIDRTMESLLPKPTPAPEPAMVTHDDTVRAVIAHLNAQGFSWAPAAEAHISAKFLEPPTPDAPEPERYVTVEEVADAMKDIGGTLVASRCAVLSRLDKHAAKRGPMLTPEQALEAWREVGDTASASRRGYGETEMLAGFRLAAKQGGGE